MQQCASRCLSSKWGGIKCGKKVHLPTRQLMPHKNMHVSTVRPKSSESDKPSTVVHHVVQPSVNDEMYLYFNYCIICISSLVGHIATEWQQSGRPMMPSRAEFGIVSILTFTRFIVARNGPANDDRGANYQQHTGDQETCVV